MDLGLNAEEKKTLHEIAHTVIWNKASGKEVPEFHVQSERLKELRGAFVTITKRGNLQGVHRAHQGAKAPVQNRGGDGRSRGL